MANETNVNPNSLILGQRYKFYFIDDPLDDENVDPDVLTDGPIYGTILKIVLPYYDLPPDNRDELPLRYITITHRVHAPSGDDFSDDQSFVYRGNKLSANLTWADFNIRKVTGPIMPVARSVNPQPLALAETSEIYDEQNIHLPRLSRANAENPIPIIEATPYGGGKRRRSRKSRRSRKRVKRSRRNRRSRRRY